MNLLVTGAAGFLGRHVVAEALRRGHHVRAMVRPGTEDERLPCADHPEVEFVYADLRSRRGLEEALAGVEALLHLAAGTAGDFYGQFEGSVIATENLLEVMKTVGPARIVLISSFSVYGYLERASFSVMDESAPIDKHMDARDDYAYTKFAQEELVRRYAKENDWPLVVLRPGVIYGPGKVFGARLGAQLSPTRWTRIGAWAQVPVTYVENCAQAVVLAGEKEDAAGETYNVVDDNPPTQRAFVKHLQRRSSPRPAVIPIPWTFMRFLARSAWLVNTIFLGGKAKMPGILIPARLHARFKPLRYSNAHIRESLGWTPRYSLEEALDRCFNESVVEAALLVREGGQPSVSREEKVR